MKAPVMNARFQALNRGQKAFHINHMLGRKEDHAHTNNNKVVVWIGKRGCPMVIDRTTRSLEYFATLQEAVNACNGNEVKVNGVQISLF